MNSQEWKQMLLSRLDLRGLIVEDVLMKIVKSKMEEIVKDSSNTFDDAAFAMLWPLLEKGVTEAVDEQFKKLAE